MSIVFLNRNIRGNGKVLSFYNKAKHKGLTFVVNEKDFPENFVIKENVPFKAHVRYLVKNGFKFIFINKQKIDAKDTIGIFINTEFGYSCLTPEYEIFTASCKIGRKVVKFGIYRNDAILVAYKKPFKKFPVYYQFNEVTGWEYLGLEREILRNPKSEIYPYIIDFKNKKKNAVSFY